MENNLLKNTAVLDFIKNTTVEEFLLLKNSDLSSGVEKIPLEKRAKNNLIKAKNLQVGDFVYLTGLHWPFFLNKVEFLKFIEQKPKKNSYYKFKIHPTEEQKEFAKGYESYPNDYIFHVYDPNVEFFIYPTKEENGI